MYIFVERGDTRGGLREKAQEEGTKGRTFLRHFMTVQFNCWEQSIA
jgi:hypothetical protein